MDKKEIWIEQTLASLDGATRAAANPLLYQKIKARMEASPKVVSISPPTAWVAAAGIALLITINIVALTKFSSSKAMKNQAKQEYISDLNTISI